MTFSKESNLPNGSMVNQNTLFTEHTQNSEGQTLTTTAADARRCHSIPMTTAPGRRQNSIGGFAPSAQRAAVACGAAAARAGFVVGMRGDLRPREDQRPRGPPRPQSGPGSAYRRLAQVTPVRNGPFLIGPSGRRVVGLVAATFPRLTHTTPVRSLPFLIGPSIRGFWIETAAGAA